MHSPELELFETDFSVIELIGRKGLRVTKHDSGHHLTDCPGCGSPAWVLPTGLFCDSLDCRFTAGGPLEVETTLSGGSMYDALFRFESMFPDKKDLWQAANISETRRRIARQAQSRRMLFEFFLRLPEQQQSVEELSILRESTGHLTSHLKRQMTMYLLGSSSVGGLADFLSLREISHRLDPKKPAVVIPLFRKHHEISSMLVWVPGGTTSEVVVSPCHLAFSGLLNCSPASHTTFCFGDPLTALHWGRALAMRDTLLHTVGVSVDLDCPEESLMGDFVYCPSDDESPLLGAALRKCAPNTLFSPGEPGVDEAVSWEEYIGLRLSSDLELSGGVLSTPTLLFAQGADLTGGERSHLIHRLRSEGYLQAAKQLSEGFSTRTIHRVKGVSLLETPDGYAAAKKGETGKEPVSNFTLHFDRNIVFPDQLAVFHGGILRFGGKDHNIVIGAEDLDTGPKCQSSVREALMRTGEDMTALPTVYSPSHYKGVVSYLRESVASLPPAKGVASLGWHPDRKTFTTPQWQLGMDGAKGGPFDFHPTRVSLGFFDSTPPSFASHTPQDIPPGMADLCRLILAGVHRTFCHLHMEGVPLEQSQAAQAAVSRLFSVLGQKRPVNAHGLQPEGLGKWPVFGYEHNHHTLRRSDNFILGFCDRGFRLEGLEDMDEADVDAIGLWLNGAIYRLSEKLLTHGTVGLERQRRALFFCELLTEGTILVENLFGAIPAGWDTAPESFEMTEKLLDMTSPSTLGDYFSYTTSSQRVQIHHTRAQGIDEGILSVEMQKISESVERYDEYISVPSPIMYSVLRHYYGVEIQLPKVKEERRVEM